MLSLVGTGCDFVVNLSATILQVARYPFASGLDHGWFQAEVGLHRRDFMGRHRNRVHGLLRQTHTVVAFHWPADSDYYDCSDAADVREWHLQRPFYSGFDGKSELEFGHNILRDGQPVRIGNAC